MAAQTQECLIQFIDKFMSLPVKQEKILTTTIFMDDELPQESVHAIYKNGINNPSL